MQIIKALTVIFGLLSLTAAWPMTDEGEGDKLIENILSYIENAMSMEDYKGGDEQGKIIIHHACIMHGSNKN